MSGAFDAGPGGQAPETREVPSRPRRDTLRAMKPTLEALQEEVLAFRDAREWAPFHTPRNLTLALASEVGEIADILRWVPDDEAARIAEPGDPRRALLADELADVQQLLLLLAHSLRIDLAQALRAKQAKNESAYPVETSRGRAEKRRT
jgi:dCTP diphosphatase